MRFFVAAFFTSFQQFFLLFFALKRKFLFILMCMVFYVVLMHELDVVRLPFKLPSPFNRSLMRKIKTYSFMQYICHHHEYCCCMRKRCALCAIYIVDHVDDTLLVCLSILPMSQMHLRKKNPFKM